MPETSQSMQSKAQVMQCYSQDTNDLQSSIDMPEEYDSEPDYCAGYTFFPVFAAGKCRSLLRSGMKSVVAGIPRRPHLPNAKETMTFVAEYLSKLNGVALDQPTFIHSSSPLVSMNLHLLNARMHMRHS